MRPVPAYRLKPASSAVPTAAKDEKNNNNDEERLRIHDEHSLQCDGYGFGLFANDHAEIGTSYGRRRRTKKKSVNYVTNVSLDS